MKRYLNLNDFSAPALKGIFTIGLLLPAGLFLVFYLLEWLGLPLPLLTGLARGLFVVGAFLLLLFIILVVLEQIQDAMLYRRYLRERGRQVQEECPYCGNRRLHPFDHFCMVCGKKIQRAG